MGVVFPAAIVVVAIAAEIIDAAMIWRNLFAFIQPFKPSAPRQVSEIRRLWEISQILEGLAGPKEEQAEAHRNRTRKVSKSVKKQPIYCQSCVYHTRSYKVMG